MNFRQMEAFRAVMLTKSITSAANQLFKTQPAVSMLITTLEKEVGFPLFERHKKRLVPTPEANYLYTEIEAIFARLEDVNQTVQDIQNKQYGFLRIGCMPGPSTFFMPEILSDFLEQHPKVRASLQTRPADEIIKWVASEQYDIGLTDSLSSSTNIEKFDNFKLPCICAIPSNHPLAAQEMITPKLLNKEPIITLSSDHRIYHDLAKVFESHKCRMNIRIQTRFFIPALQFVERGLGICVMDPISVKSYCSYAQPGKVVFRTFAPAVSFRLSIIYPETTPVSRITRVFADELNSKIKQLQSQPEQLLKWGQ
ncbi:LysR family transcriptional regulator [Marinomonas agarivorans]|nr:LysR family transcriptional regulator [Marinomonas agarivorans]